MLDGIYVLMELKRIKTEKGSYRIAKLGDAACCSNFEVFLNENIEIPEGLKVGQDVMITLELKGSKNLYATVKGFEMAI